MSFDLSFGFPLSSLVKGFESIDYRITSTQKSCETHNTGLFFHHFENNSRISGAKITQGSEITQAFW